MSDEYLAGYIIEFSDGGPPEGQILHRGTKKSCDQVVALLAAVSYSGDRTGIPVVLTTQPGGSGCSKQRELMERGVRRLATRHPRCGPTSSASCARGSDAD